MKNRLKDAAEIYVNLMMHASPTRVLQDSRQQVQVTPNPCDGYVNVFGLEVLASYEVRDVLGVVRMKGKCDEASLTLDCTNLPSGTYLARITNSWIGKTVKFVKE